MLEIERYYTPISGLELEPDVNAGNRQCENGILFFVTTMFLAFERIEQLNEGGETFQFLHEKFPEVVSKLEVKPGLYDRGALDAVYEPRSQIRTISHDNISAISAGSYFCKTKHAKDIYDYGLKHCFLYNNNLSGWDTPMNPGNYSIWSKFGGSKIFFYFFMWIFTINFFIANAKEPANTSEKLLNFVKLYPLRKDWLFGIYWKVYCWQMKRMYGEYFMEKLTEIYYRYSEHPARVMAKGLKF